MLKLVVEVDVVENEEEEAKRPKSLPFILASTIVGPKAAALFAGYQIEGASAYFTKVTIPLISNVFFASPACYMSALDTVYFIAAVNLFKGYFAAGTASEGQLVDLELVELDVFPLFSLFKAC